MRVGTRIRAVALASVGLFMIAACGGSSGPSVKEGGTLTYIIDADAQTLNPFEAGDLPSMMYVRVPPSFTDGPDEDRKSTRLNSSHVAISYAVFCLKKKK